MLSTADSGAGSLCQAIRNANGTPGSNVIEFAIGAGVQTINLASALPFVTNPVTLDGTTQPGYAGAPGVRITATATAIVSPNTSASLTFGDASEFAADVAAS